MTPYADPRLVRDIASCYFYHRMELPGVGLVGGQWDLRPTIDGYLAGFPFAGKRVLDVGAASGFPSFEMERRGADVVSFDMSPDGRWDIVPVAGTDLDAAVGHKRESWKALTNAYWFAHAALRSRAKVFYGDIYRLPETLGIFDVAFLGSVLLHLQNPFEGLRSAARRTRDALIVTEPAYPAGGAQMEFVPTRLGPSDTWWRLSEGSVTQMMDVLGFDIASVTRSRHTLVDEKNPQAFEFFSVVGRRVLTGGR
jgi:SAM-dependent methyltransferase